MTKCVEHRRRVLGAEEDVEIADRLGPAPQAAADLGADDLRGGPGPPRGSARPAAAPGSGGSGRRPTRRSAIPSRILASVLAPNPLSLAILPASAAARRSARLSIFSASCSALIFFGPSPGTRSSATRPGGVVRAQLVVGGQLAGRRELDDLGDASSRRCPGTSARLPSAIISDRSAGRPLERLRGVVIGPAAKRVLAPDLEQRPHLVQDLGDARGFHGSWSPSPSGLPPHRYRVYPAAGISVHRRLRMMERPISISKVSPPSSWDAVSGTASRSWTSTPMTPK